MDKQTKFTEKHMSSINPQQLTLKEIPSTIRMSYERGFDDSDELWRKAVKRYCETNGISFVDMFPKMLMAVSNVAKEDCDSLN